MPDDRTPQRPDRPAFSEVEAALGELNDDLKAFETTEVVERTRRAELTGTWRAAWDRAELVIRQVDNRSAVIGRELERANSKGPDSGDWPTRVAAELTSLALTVAAAVQLAQVFAEGKQLPDEHAQLRMRVEELSQRFSPATDDAGDPLPWPDQPRDLWIGDADGFLESAKAACGEPPGGPPSRGPDGEDSSGPEEPRAADERRHVGAGIVVVPPAPRRDPDSQSPEVDATDANALARGERVADNYKVVRVIARSNLSLVYLAQDHAVGRRWCVLKGMRDPADPDAVEAAKTERQILALISDSRFVEVYNIVEHETPDGDERVRQRYIVMAHVQGIDLGTLCAERGGTLLAPEAIAYIHGMLPALSHLHQRGLVHSDIKPSNIMHSSDDMMKLVDLGAVRRVGLVGHPHFGTEGYIAPEERATARADLYSTGRTLASLILGQGWVQRQVKGPPAAAEEALERHDCLHRFLQRACAVRENERFANADEMAEALYGVMCQVAAATDGQSRPHTRDRWGPPQPTLDHPTWDQLPVPTLPRQPLVPSQLASAPSAPEAVIKIAEGLREPWSWSDRATLALAYCGRGDFDKADEMAEELIPKVDEPPTGTDSLRAAVGAYLQGQIAMASGDDERLVVRHFDSAYTIATGEPACALALAVALEAATKPGSGTAGKSDKAKAEELYSQVAVTDPNWVVAISGKARVLSSLGERRAAAEAMITVPPSHPLRSEALKRACLILQTDANADEQVTAEASIDHIVEIWAREKVPKVIAFNQALYEFASALLPSERPLTSLTPSQAELAVALFSLALAAQRGHDNVRGPIGWIKEPNDVELARALAESLEALAELTPGRARNPLLDAAARVRPWRAVA